jgi:predicted dienelactone hydrolase
MHKWPSLFLALVLLWSCGSSSSNPDISTPDQVIADDGSPATDAPDSADGNDITAPDVPHVPSTLDFPVDQSGPYNIGYRTFPHSYTVSATGEERLIDIHIWYPTEATDGAHPIYEIFPDDISIIDAPLAPPVSPSGYPVHIYSHGHVGFAGSTAAVMRYFASHGWVVAGPDHTGNTFSDNISPRPIDIYYLRPLDIIATLDALENLATNDPLAGQLGTDRVVLSGHSFGVHTCWASAGATFDMAAIATNCAEGGSFFDVGCSAEAIAQMEAGTEDARIVGIIPMAGSINREFFGPQGHSTVTIPILSMSGSADLVGAAGQFETTGDLDLTWIDLEGGCHQTFGLGVCATLDPDEGFQIINTYALAFARNVILNDTSATITKILDGSSEVSAKVHFQAH